MAFAIGIDASTQSVKAVAFGPDGTQLGLGRMPLSLDEPRPGWAEQDPQDWYDAMVGALRDLGRQVDLGQATGLAITCQRDTVVLLDSQYRAVRPAFVWLDNRAADQVRRFGPLGVHEITGKPASYTDALYKLIWVRENEPETLARTATVYDTSGYLIHRLTGRRVTSLATAGTLTLLDIKARDFSPTLLGFAGLRRDQLPDLVESIEVAGSVSADAAVATGLPEGLPVISTLGDGQAAGLGSGVAHGDTGYISLGTGIAVGAASDRYVHSPAFRTLEGYAPGKFYLEGVIANGAYLITWFVKTFGISGRPELSMSAEESLNSLAEQVPVGSDGLLCLPYFSGVLSPYWDPHARGSFLGLRGTHGLPEMYRAVLEGITYEVLLTFRALEDSRATPLRDLVVMGGGAASRLWLQIIADICGRDVQVCNQSEVTSLGAAMHAAAATGLLPGATLEETVAAMTSRGTIYRPRPDAVAEYARWFDIYRDVYEANRGIFERIDARMAS